MSMPIADGTVSARVVDQSDEVVSAGRGWTVNRWVVADFTDSSGTYAPMRVRAEVIQSGNRSKAVITELQLGNPGESVLPRQVNALGRLMPQLPGEVLALLAFPESDVEPSPDEFIRAINSMIRTPNLTQFEREDEVLHRWDNEFQPNGYTQEQAAAEMGLSHNTFRKYLQHARARRK